MAWSGFPRTADTDSILADDFAQIRAAIVERQADVGGAAPSAAPAHDDTITAALINNYRAAIDALTVLFFDPSTGGYWTKASVRAAAGLSGTDWYRIPPGYAGGPTYGTVSADTELIYAAHVNEMYSVLKQLRWLRTADCSVYTAKYVSPYVGASYVSYAAAWAAMKVAYAGGAWTPLGEGGCYARGEEQQVGGVYYGGFVNSRVESAAVVVPNYSVAISDTKIIFNGVIYTTGAGSIDLYEQANFAGSAANHAAVSGYPIWDVSTVVKGTTVYYSYRNNPYDANPANYLPDPDNFRPADPPSGIVYKGYRMGLVGLLCQLGYLYV